MSTIQTYSNWEYTDCYGKPEIGKYNKVLNAVKHNDKVEITWPSGKKEIKNIILVESSQYANDMGNTVTIPVSKAYISIEYEGTTPVIGLTNSNIQVKKLS